MALITLMVFNAPIMAISLSQPNSPHSINETPGLLHSIRPKGTQPLGGESDVRSYPDQTPLSSLSTYTDSKRLYVSSSRPSALT